MTLLAALAAVTIVSVATGSAGFFIGQFALWLSVAASLFLLSDRPLINPVQAFVILFYWWFAVGPVAISGYEILNGHTRNAKLIQEAGLDSLWIVAVGLPLYALVARRVLRGVYRYKRPRRYSRGSEKWASPSTILAWLGVGAGAWLLLFALRAIGIPTVTAVNFLGGFRADSWWGGLLLTATGLVLVAQSALMYSLASPSGEAKKWVRGLAIIALVVGTLVGLLSGWKGAVVVSFFFLLLARMSRTQRLPWAGLVIMALLLAFVIFPFVSLVRFQAITGGVVESSERLAIISQVAQNYLSDPQDLDAFAPALDKVRLPFRDLYPVAGMLAQRADLLSGYLGGKTIVWGLEAVVPRALLPSKPDLNIGNYYSRSVGAALEITSEEDLFTNIAVGVPFDVTANFGWLAGIATFPALALVWAWICAAVLSPQHLHDHPLSPWFIWIGLAVEAPLGQYLAALRGAAVVLLVAWGVWRLKRGVGRTLGKGDGRTRPVNTVASPAVAWKDLE